MAASGTGARVAYITETTRGVTPGTPNFTVLRAISRNINQKVAALESAEVRASRQRSDVRHGFHSVEGEIQLELTVDAHNDWLLASVGTNSWFTPAPVVGTTLSVTGTDTFTRGAGNWIDDFYRPGDWISSTSFPTGANNGTFRVLTVSATGLTVVAVLVNEAGTGSSAVGYLGKKCIVGNTGLGLKTMSIERELTDFDSAGNDLYQIFRGVAVNQLSVSAQPDQLLQATFRLLGMTSDIDQSATLDTNSVYTDALTNSPLAGIDATFYNGAFAFDATGFDFTLDNQRTGLPLLGQTTTKDIYEGVAKIGGTVSTLLVSATSFLQQFQAEGPQTGGFQIKINELGTSHFLVFNFYNVKFTTHEMDPPPSGPVVQVQGWEALQRTFTGASLAYLESMHIQRSTST